MSPLRVGHPFPMASGVHSVVVWRTARARVVLEAEQPTSSDRRGRGKTDAIDAHLAVLWDGAGLGSTSPG